MKNTPNKALRSGRQEAVTLAVRALHQATRNRQGARSVRNELQRQVIKSNINRPGTCTCSVDVESFFHSRRDETYTDGCE